MYLYLFSINRNVHCSVRKEYSSMDIEFFIAELTNLTMKADGSKDARVKAAIPTLKAIIRGLKSETPVLFTRDHLVINIITKEVFWKGFAVKGFTDSEFKMLLCIARSREGGDSRHRICVALWGEPYCTQRDKNIYRPLNMRMSRIKKCFKEVYPHFNQIQSHYNAGYHWVDE